MTPPTFYSASRKDGKKKVFSSTSLGSIDSQGPVSPNTNAWDTETDHILSFFLGGSSDHVGSVIPDFASTHPGDLPTRTSSNDGKAQPPVGNSNDHMDDEDDDVIPPPTPAVQFYAPTQALLQGAFQPRPMVSTSFPKHGDLHAPPTGEMTSASSSSSLSSITANLMTGVSSGYPSTHAPHQYIPQSLPVEQQGPLHPFHISPHMAGFQQSMSGGSGSAHQSPISPAALIGQVHENLMLPPPRQGLSPLQQVHGGQASLSEQQQRHLVWLRDLNAMAKAVTQNSSPSQVPVQPQQLNQDTPTSTQGSFQQFQQIIPEGMMFSPGFIVPFSNKPPPVETAEKRAKRLERNRESARKSRRRKKERLLALEEQVNALHGEIEAERRTQINAMVSKLRKCRLAETNSVVEALKISSDSSDLGNFLNVIQTTGCSSDIVRAVQDFQHNSLKQVVLPRYHKLLLWLTVQPESFFSLGKDDYTSRMTRLNRTVQKISSKQIGDELVNGTREDADDDEQEGDEESIRAAGQKRVTFKDTKKKAASPSSTQPVNLTTYANDAARVWPLLCYELSLSVDQEEKFVSLHKKAQTEESMPHSRLQMTAAVASTDSLREASESLSRAIGQREELCLASILNPEQVFAYQTWLVSNRARCSDLMSRSSAATAPSIDSSLHDICRRLNEVMKISMNER